MIQHCHPRVTAIFYRCLLPILMTVLEGQMHQTCSKILLSDGLPPLRLFYLPRMHSGTTDAWKDIHISTGVLILQLHRLLGATSWTGTVATEGWRSSLTLGGWLTADTVYEIQIRTIRNTIPSDWSTSIFERTLLSTPTGLHSTDRTTNSVTLKRNTVTDATGYEIQYSVSTDNAVGTSSPSNIVQIRTVPTAPVEMQLTTPQSITATSASATSLIITWNEAENASGYRVEYANEDFSNSAIRNVDGNTEVNLTGLTMGQQYYVHVIAIGAGSDIDSVASHYATATPTPNLRSTSQTGNSITLAWDVPTSSTEQLLQYRVAGTNAWQTWISIARGATTATIVALKANTNYEFRLTAMDADSPGTAMTNAITTSSQSLPVNDPSKPAFRVNARVSTINSITLTWNANSKAALRNEVYEITYQARGETHRLTVLRSAGSITIGGLDAGTRYSFTIVAKNADGKDTITARNGKENLATSTIRATTQGFTATRVMPFLKRASATSDTVSLQWRVPTARMPAGTTISYIIEVYHDTRRTQSVTSAEVGEVV